VLDAEAAAQEHLGATEHHGDAVRAFLAGQQLSFVGH
jgi:hypothetical protein